MNTNNYGQRALEAHKSAVGKLSVELKMPLNTVDDLSIAYTPGVAEPCKEIAKNTQEAYTYTATKHMVAVISDGSAVLGLGNIGPEASLPVMEGKCALFKKFAGVDAFPIVLATQDIEEIIKTVKAIAPTFGGINLEDISAPKCFEIESRLKRELPIPVMHDDQHGTAIVTLAGMINALKITGKQWSEIKVVVSGAGAAGVAVVKLLVFMGLKNVLMLDTKGIICSKRDDLNPIKKEMLSVTNPDDISGNLDTALENADVFIGVSSPGVLNKERIARMKKDPIIFAMANPIPEIMPEEAKLAGARIIATGRSDFPNQINNVLAFPGLFKGAFKCRAQNFTRSMFVAAAHAIANAVENPHEDCIIPSPFDPRIPNLVADAVVNIYQEEGATLVWQ